MAITLDQVGVAVGIAGFALTLWQIGKTKRAADAARDAAAEAVAAVRRVQTVATIHDICGRSRDLLHWTREKNLKLAAATALELREALAKFPIGEVGVAAESDAWLGAVSAAGSIHDRLETASLTNRLDVAERERLIHAISRNHSYLHSLVPQVAASGGTSADP